MSEHSLTQGGYMSSEEDVSRDVNGSEMGAQVSVSSRKDGGKASGAFRTISEVADLLDVQQHVLRFWETKFSQVKPLKRGGGRRYYRPDDVAILQKIHHLLYSEGYTIKGVQKLLKGQSKGQIVSDLKRESAKVPVPSNDQEKMAVTASQVVKAGLSANQKALLEGTLSDLKALRSMIQTDEENS